MNLGSSRMVRLTVVYVILSSILSVAQTSSGSGKFHWDWRKAQYAQKRLEDSTALPARTIQEIENFIAEQLRPLMSNLGIGSEKELQEIAAKTRIKSVLLAPHVRAFVVQGSGENSGCSLTGNCPFWLLKQSRDSYVLLLDEQAQSFTIQPTKTNGVYDIVLGLHASGLESQLTEYKFDGTRYSERDCYLATWRYLGRDNEYHDSRVPRLSRCSPAANAEGRISLEVTDETGAVVQRAQVAVRPHLQPQTSAWRTDDHGRFSFSMPPGDYDLFVVSPLFREWSKQVRVREEKTINFKIVLNPAKISQIVDAGSNGLIDTGSVYVSQPPAPELVILSVQDQDREPIVGARVWVTYQDPTAYMETDEKGMITLKLLPRDYEMVVVSPGFTRWQQHLKVEEGRGRLLNVILSKLPPLP